jgi:transposase-like protein
MVLQSNYAFVGVGLALPIWKDNTRMNESYTAEFKAQVVLALLTGAKSAHAISAEYDIPESVLEDWRQTFIDRAPMVFEDKPKQHIKPGEVPSKPGEYVERGPHGQELDVELESEVAFNTSLERSIKENADVWAELAKHYPANVS